MKKHFIILPCFLSMLICSCSYNDALEVESDIKSQVLFSVDEFIPESLTRTNCDPSNNYRITWASGDAIGIFPREGDQEPFVIPAEQVGQSKAAFDGGYWALKAGKTYNAYYPFSRDNYASSEMKMKIPVTYLGQYQNGRECNVGSYDYTYSDWKESVGGASVSFSFHHLGSFLVLKLPIPATATYTSLTLNAGNAVIPTTGTYDLTATTPAFVSKTKASSLSMQLNSFTGVAGENATFYMMVPPMDLSSETLTITLSAGSTSCSYSIESKNISAAKLYNLTGTPVSSTVTGTVDEWLPAQNMHNGHEYVEINGVKWATCNIGANRCEEFGNYYSWGATTSLVSSIEKNSNGGYVVNWINPNNKYSYYNYNILPANPSSLPLDNDVAHLLWGGKWRMPTYEEAQSLMNYANYQDVEVNGIMCREYINDDKHLFLPTSGHIGVDRIFEPPYANYEADNKYCYDVVSYTGVWGSFWTSTLNSSNNKKAYYLTFLTQTLYLDTTGGGGFPFRHCAMPIRPVYAE